MDKIFKALADKNRRKILTLLKKRELSVNEILQYLEIRQATLSNHLSILRKAGLVEVRTKGKQRIYKISRDQFNKFVGELDKFAGLEGVGKGNEIIVRRIINKNS